MDDGALGKQYGDGDVICRQGERGDRMFVMQAGRAVVSLEQNGREIVLGEMVSGDIFGEMAIFDRQPRSATVRAKGDARVLTLDKVGFLRRVHEDPSLAYRILQAMSRRIRGLSLDFSRARLGSTGPPRHLVIVARDRRESFERLTQDFADNPSVRVLLDRRTGERRRQDESRMLDRRTMDRRRDHARLDDALRAPGVVIVCAQDGS